MFESRRARLEIRTDKNRIVCNAHRNIFMKT